MQKDWKFLIENRFSRKKIENFGKYWKISKISKNRRKFQLKSNFFDFSIFRFFEIFGIFQNFRKFSKIFRNFFGKYFQNRFSIKSFQCFSMNFFLNRFRISWGIQKWRLEMRRVQRGRVRWAAKSICRICHTWQNWQRQPNYHWICMHQTNEKLYTSKKFKTIYSSQLSGFSNSEGPCSRGRTAPRVQSS